MKTDNSNAAARERHSLSGLVVSVACDSGHRFSKSKRDHIVLMQGHGIEGDAHAGPFVRHRYLARRRPHLPNLRKVHLIASELLDALRASGYDVGPGDLGENVTTSGPHLERLPLGTLVELGPEAAIELTGLRTPCIFIDRFRPRLKQKMISKNAGDPPFRCGVMGTARVSGRIRPGDEISVRWPPWPWKALPAL
jgi:MOSC domain-containing protein YiiM